MATKLPLHICEANASLTKLQNYDMLSIKDGDVMANDKLSELSMEFAVEIALLTSLRKNDYQSFYTRSPSSGSHQGLDFQPLFLFYSDL